MYLSLSEWRTKGNATRGPNLQRVAFRVSPTIIALGIVSMLTDISSESVAAVLPLFITGALGLSMVAYGFLEGVNQGLSAVVRIAAGYAADRSDKPKQVAMAGYGLSMLARVGLLFAQGFAGITAVIGIDRIGKGIRTAPRDAMIQHAAQPEHLARSFGVHRMLDTIGATIGPLLAFAVLFLVPDGFRAVFVLSLAFAVIGVAVLALVVPNTGLRGKPAAAGNRAGSGAGSGAGLPRATTAPVARPRVREIATPAMRRLLATAGLLGLVTVGDGFVYLALMEHGHLQTAWFPLLFVGTNTVFLALAVPVGRMADRTNRATVFVLGHVALGAAYLAATAATGLAVVLVCLALLGVFYAATDGVLAALASQWSPPGGASTGIAAAQTVVAVARLVASTGFGVLWVVFGAVPTMTGAAVVLAAMVPVALWLMAGARRAGTEDAQDNAAPGDPGGGPAGTGPSGGGK